MKYKSFRNLILAGALVAAGAATYALVSRKSTPSVDRPPSLPPSRQVAPPSELPRAPTPAGPATPTEPAAPSGVVALRPIDRKIVGVNLIDVRFFNYKVESRLFHEVLAPGRTRCKYEGTVKLHDKMASKPALRILLPGWK